MFLLKQLRPWLLDSDISEAKIIKCVDEMSYRFTQKRDELVQYTLDRQAVSAYSMLYMPTNIPKLSFVLDSLSLDILEIFKQADLIDYGSGPGTFSIAWLQYFSQYQGHITCIDQSDLMLEQAQKIMSGLFPERSDIAFRTSLSAYVKNERRPLVLLFGHSLNELGIEKGLELIKKINPDFILLMEPGTKSFFSQMIQLRQSLLLSHYHIHYPCYSENACAVACRTDDWCHQVIQLTHPPDVERLCQMANLDRRHMPMIAFVFGKKPLQENLGRVRYLQLIEENKFSFVLAVCMEEQGKNCYRQLQVMKRNLTNGECKELRHLSRGRELLIECDKVIAEDYWRVKIKKLA